MTTCYILSVLYHPELYDMSHGGLEICIVASYVGLVTLAFWNFCIVPWLCCYSTSCQAVLSRLFHWLWLLRGLYVYEVVVVDERACESHTCRRMSGVFACVGWLDPCSGNDIHPRMLLQLGPAIFLLLWVSIRFLVLATFYYGNR